VSTVFLDLSDASLSLIAESEIIHSPGAALLTSTGLSFGEPAFAQLKRKPLHVRTDFWNQLSTSPLNGSFGAARHSADLVYGHLKSLVSTIKSDSKLVLLAPGNIQQSQLELLLGILDSLGITTAAVFDRAIIAHSKALGPGLNVNLQWRQLVLSELQINRGELTAQAVTALPGLGYLDLLELCLEDCAELCIEQTRFDPRRSADSEQTLLDAIPGLLNTLSNTPEASIDLGSTNFKVPRSRLEVVGQRVSAAIATALRDNDRDSVSVDEALAAFPGVPFNNIITASVLRSAAVELLTDYDYSAALTRITSRPVESGAHSSPTGDAALDHAAAEIQYRSDAPASTHSSDASASTANPTHLMIDATAYPIEASENSAIGFGVIFRDGQACIQEDLRHRINVLSVMGTHDKLTTGTRLYRDDGKEALLIFVET
jgi:hypothetical protein